MSRSVIVILIYHNNKPIDLIRPEEGKQIKCETIAINSGHDGVS
jgi:hypothetical protein